MSEQNQNQNQNQEGQKTLVAFVVGLLIGGLIVWMFAGSTSEAPVVDDTYNDDTSEVMNDEDDTVDINDDAEDTNNDTTDDINGTNDNSSNGDTTSTMEVGDGSVTVNDQSASDVVTLEGVTYPMTDGWIGVTEYSNDRVGTLLGVARFSEGEGLVPENIQLLRSTEPGKTYAVVFYGPSANNEFSVATNERVEGVFATFTAE